MLQGLRLMNTPELSELVKLTRIDAKTREGLDDEQRRSHILSWAAKAVNSPSQDPVAIEAACLRWVAEHWGVNSEDDIDELERALRMRIAQDAVDYLAPVWWFACAIIAAGPADAVGPKVRLLEKAASLVVPSRSARQKLASQWREKIAAWGLQAAHNAEVKKLVEPLRRNLDHVDQALTLALVISLADGRLSLEEERALLELGSECGRAHEQIKEVIRRVNDQYWDHQVQVSPKKGAVETPESERLTAMQAAQRTLDTTGTLEGLCLEACDKVVHLGGEAQEEANAPKSGWRRVLGTVSGQIGRAHV